METYQLIAYLFCLTYFLGLSVIWEREDPLNKLIKNVFICLTLANLSQLAFFMMMEKQIHVTFISSFTCYFSAFVGFLMSLFSKDSSSKWRFVLILSSFLCIIASVVYNN